MHNCCLPTSAGVNQAGEAKRSSKNYKHLKTIILTLVYSYNLFATHVIYQQKKHMSEEEQQSRRSLDKKERVFTIRPLNMEDFREAKNQVRYLHFLT